MNRKQATTISFLLKFAGIPNEIGEDITGDFYVHLEGTPHQIFNFDQAMSAIMRSAHQSNDFLDLQPVKLPFTVVTL
jgi:hypothetical protein